MASRTVSVVFNVESDELEPLGTYHETIEDTVVYFDAAGVDRYAPQDCVEVVTLACFDIVGARFWAVSHGA